MNTSDQITLYNGTCVILVLCLLILHNTLYDTRCHTTKTAELISVYTVGRDL